ncbi:MAG: FIST C-terminal domain-containing protein [Deltaproteobacteria bacterium]|nr:FIST C-terminal domain-containing protein [Deltaproteobacteria bacterium]
MRYRSASSISTDAYLAGLEIGESLKEISPETVIFFASISYERNFAELFDGMRDGLGSEDAVLFGGTGDGFYETSQTANYGASALGIHSGGKIRWSAASAVGVEEDSFLAARSCALAAAAGTGSPPTFAFVLADGTKADGSGIVAGVESVIGAPFFGGLTGDDRKFKRSRVLLNGAELENAVAILAASGEIPFAVNAASGWTPIGAPGNIEDGESGTIRRINGMTAQAFMKEQLGKPLGEADLGIVPLAAYRQADDEYFFLRTPSHLDRESGAIATFGSIEAGTAVRVCTATRPDVLDGVLRAAEGVEARGFTPAAALVVSCAGRKWLLSDSGKEEVDLVLSAFGGKIPMAGFPSFGEISPFRKPGGAYTQTFFHNVTFVVCLLGE